jgi:hypothetical protein
VVPILCFISSFPSAKNSFSSHLVPEPGGPEVLADDVGGPVQLIPAVLVQVRGLANVVDLIVRLKVCGRRGSKSSRRVLAVRTYMKNNEDVHEKDKVIEPLQ